MNDIYAGDLVRRVDNDDQGIVVNVLDCGMVTVYWLPPANIHMTVTRETVMVTQAVASVMSGE